MHLVWTLILGLVAGAIAKLLVPGKQTGGWIITALLGVAGSFLGSWAQRRFHLFPGIPAAGFILSLLGAMLFLMLHHLVRRKAP